MKLKERKFALFERVLSITTLPKTINERIKKKDNTNNKQFSFSIKRVFEPNRDDGRQWVATGLMVSWSF